ncbi:nose resistant to fluoxetine protein 6-like [Phymastichus coffea]|uniref:nose resistant to fluoxetine protein 6-like n=1 Tax=Phymastichus coffea TaxID=108790 RepID=UPI00273C746D|nr:nose resistant to fluoxetine protein 6-like [Phymastichus coffea]
MWSAPRTRNSTAVCLANHSELQYAPYAEIELASLRSAAIDATMYVRRKSWIGVLSPLILMLISRGDAARTNYDDVLESQLIDDQLRLLGPEGLLENWRRLVREESSRGRVGNDTGCARDLAIYERAIDQRESWALKMLDASSKLPVGVLQGHVIDMGMFDECTEARGQRAGFEIRGRHCMYAIKSGPEERFILDPTLSICVPASCGAEDVTGLLRDAIGTSEKLQILGVSVVSASCTALPSDLATRSPAFVISFTIAGAYITFLVFCTLYDLALRRRKLGQSSSASLFERLSLLKSAETILSTNTRDNNLPVIHGLRAISTCWIVLVHEYLVQLLGVNVNAVYITKWFSSWGSMYPLVGVFSVDTFLALSGFLMAWNFFKHKTSNFNIALYYLHRFIRLTFPVVTLTVATFVLLPGLGASGARYEWLQNIFVTGCGSKWWSVLLYFQNFFETDNYCLLHLWSLSVDMQLYWLSPIVLYPLYKRPRLGLTLLFTLILTVTRAMEAFQNVYQMTYTRASPWLIGILFAYIVTQHKSVRPNKTLISIGWLLAIASFLFCMLGTRYFTHANYEYNLVREVTFAALQRPLWAYGICWIIYTSIHNDAGPIANFLSAKIFLPISRISYSIYLVHLVLPALQVGTLRTAKYFNQYSILQSYISDMVLAIIVAFFFSILFEMPILILEDTIFKRRQIREKLHKTK